MKSKIGVLTSGGDSQGMNTVLYYLAKQCELKNIELIGFYHGYQGILDDEKTVLSSTILEPVKNKGGSILKSSRCMAMFSEEGLKKVADNIKQEKLNGLIIIGGDGSAKGAEALKNKHGITSVVIPGTIDNDIEGVKLSLGHLSAVDRCKTMISWIEDTARSHDRVFIVEVMGRHSGNIAKALNTQIPLLATVLPETEVTPELLRTIDDNFNQNKSNVVVITELQPQKVEILKNELSKKYEVRINVLGHGQRGGPPTKDEIKIAKAMAIKAFENCLKGSSGMIES